MDVDDHTKPKILLRETAGEEFVITFKTFDSSVNADDFDVPKMCNQPPRK